MHPLQSYRKRTQATQADLAEILGVNRTTVARWETGARRIDRSKLEAVAEKTGIPKRELRPDLAEVMREVCQ
jgi:transcriptional regulator with XRE-family HTH domain